MRALPALAAALLLASAPRPAPAQEGEDDKKTAPGLPSRYVDCLQPKTLDVLLAAPVTQWGLSEELGQTAYDHLYGIQLCRGYGENTIQYCRQLADVPGTPEHTKVTQELGRDCASDVEFLQTYSAILARDRASAELRCASWCGLESSRAPGRLDCGEFCKEVLRLVPGPAEEAALMAPGRAEKILSMIGDRAEDACELWAERTARLTKNPVYRLGVRPMCLMMLAPSPSTCTDKLGPDLQKRCRERHAVLEALRTKDAKRCPKALRYGAVCAALAAPDKPSAASCSAAVTAFTKRFCDHRKAAGGLRDLTQLPGDPGAEEEW